MTTHKAKNSTTPEPEVSPLVADDFDRDTGDFDGVDTNPVYTETEAATADNAADISETDDDYADYEYVRMPNGKLRAVRKSDITDATDAPATFKSEAPPTKAVEVPVQHFYVHLSNGDVVRVAEEDLPTRAGSNAHHGFWQKDNKVYDVIGVYPVETEAPKN